jgi:hypothetical protein
MLPGWKEERVRKEVKPSTMPRKEVLRRTRAVKVAFLRPDGKSPRSKRYREAGEQEKEECWERRGGGKIEMGLQSRGRRRTERK